MAALPTPASKSKEVRTGANRAASPDAALDRLAQAVLEHGAGAKLIETALKVLSARVRVCVPWLF